MKKSGHNIFQDYAEVFSENGPLAACIHSFVPREQQVDLAVAIGLSIAEKRILVAEAGTGTGKTFAYLIPCLLSGKKALISTATKTLQDQLFHKDLPLLMQALGVAVRVQNLKGRANYICRYRVALHSEEGHIMTSQCANDLMLVRERLPRIIEGERGELTEISEDAAVWPYVTSTTENCLGNDCAYHQDCFLVKARQRALSAQIVVINHHLFFADGRLKDEGFGELLPGVDVVIFDEAHQLSEIATHFQGSRVSTRQCRALMNDILQEWPVLDLANQPLKQYHVQLDAILDALYVASEAYPERVEWRALSQSRAFKAAFADLLTFCDSLHAILLPMDLTAHPGLERCKSRLAEIMQTLQALSSKDTQIIRWVERRHNLLFNLTPVDIKDSFQALLLKTDAAVVFTSATLTMASSFECFLQSLGLVTAETLLLSSPFDFKQQALLYLPRGLPDPKDEHYYEALVARALPLIQACQGRCFFLFTSHRALNQVAKMLKNKIKYPLLIQGDEAKSILLARFREAGNAVLLGTATFWEGVDVKGDALSCVIIDKLPFASPTDPILRGRMAHLKSLGYSSFDVLSLPNAVLALKQGVGRLIRDVNDRGVLMIADPRLTARAYGELIFKSLPAMRKTRDENTVLKFIQSLDKVKNEAFSD